jgi:hypothetical protein
MRKHDDLRQELRQKIRDLLDKITEAEDAVIRLAQNERLLALADGLLPPRVVAQGREVQGAGMDWDGLTADPSEDRDRSAVCLNLPNLCEDCGDTHLEPVVLASVGIDADGAPILWDGQVLPGGPH